MVQNINFKDLFEFYEASPPSSVWGRIAHQIQPKKKDKFWGFNTPQLATLMIAGLVSLSLSSYLFNSIKDIPNQSLTSANPKIEYSKQSSVESNLESKIFIKKELTEKPKTIFRTNQVNSNPLSSKSSHLNNTKILHQVNELIRLDKEIISLVKEMKFDEPKKEDVLAINKEEIISKIESKPIEENTSESIIPKAETSLISKIEPENKEVVEKHSELGPIQKENSRDLFYMMPYIGSNYTQISYPSSSNSLYFSDQASFNGKIGYNIGVNLGFQISKQWSIESGLGYGQYIQTFKETKNRNERNGILYIDQLDIPLLARYSFDISKSPLPKQLSFKAGLLYNSVLKYQVNYTDRDISTFTDKSYQIEADKRQYNSLQLGYAAGFDFESFLTNRLSINLGFLGSLVSQLENFPLFNQETHRPNQFSTTFSIGTKMRF